jgi:type VI secretion system protein ImpH
MAAAGGREGVALSAALFREGHRFDFFQAVRLLERLARERARDGEGPRRHPVGEDRLPNQEVVRFRALPALSFPAGTVAQLREPDGDGEPGPAEMVVTFLGLTGPAGVLPAHYTRLLLERVRKFRDHALRDFLDLFHHRLIALFYRAWAKYRLPIAYERAHLDSGGPGMDPCTRVLYSLIGFGTGRLRGCLEVPDEALLYYAGHFAHFPRSAVALEALLRDYFGLPIRVAQFQGQWLYLSPEDRSLLPSAARPLGQNGQLGVSCVAGGRVWDVQGKFRLRVGPLTYEQFRHLLPNTLGLRSLGQLTRAYVGAELDFDVQLVLLASEVPWCRLAPRGADHPRLGWNTWVRSRPFERDVEDAVFVAQDTILTVADD